MADPKAISALTQVTAPADGFTVLARDATRPASDRIVRIPIATLTTEVKDRIAEISQIPSIQAQVNALATAQTVHEAAVSNELGYALRSDQVNETGSFEDLIVKGRVRREVDAATSNSLVFNWGTGKTYAYTISGAVTISDLFRPTGATHDDSGRQIILINSTASEWAITFPDGWVANSNRPVTTIRANETLSIYPVWTGTEVRYSYEGDQSRPLDKDDGGTGNANGVAQSPDWVVQSSGIYSSTLYDVNFGEGVFKKLDITANLTFMASSGRPASGYFKWQKVYVENTSAGPVDIDFRGEWKLVGIAAPYALGAGDAIALEFWASGPAETDVIAVALTGSAAGGGDPPPASTLGDGLIAHYAFEDATTAALTDSINAYNGALFGSGNILAQQTGIENYGWASDATTGAIVEFSTATLRPQATGVRSYSGWVNRASGFVVIAQWNDSGNQRCFRLLNSSQTWQFSYSYDGINTNTHNWPAPNNTFTDSTTYFWVLIIDHDTDVVKFSVNGNTLSTLALSGNLYASTANLSIFGRFGSTLNKMTGWQDQLRIYNRELTQAEVEELYALYP